MQIMKRQIQATSNPVHYYYVYNKPSESYIVSTLGIFRHKPIPPPVEADRGGLVRDVTWPQRFSLLSTLIGGTLPTGDGLSDYPTVVDPNLVVESWSNEDPSYAIFKNTETNKHYIYSAPKVGSGIFLAYTNLNQNQKSSLKAIGTGTSAPVPIGTGTSAPVPIGTGTSAPGTSIVIPPLLGLPQTDPAILRRNGTGPFVPLPAATTTPSTLSCAAYAAALDYNADSTKTTTSVVCSAPVTDAKSKLTIAFSQRTVGATLQPLVAPFVNVGIEEKDGKWSGFSYDGPGGRWIRVDLDGKKMKYTVQFSANSWEQKDVEVKYDADKKYTFEGGSVVFTDTDPFSSKFLGLPLPPWAVVLIAVGVLLLVIGIVAGIVVAMRRNRNSNIHKRAYPQVDPYDQSMEFQNSFRL